MEDELLEGGEELLLDNESDILVEETPDQSDGDLILSEEEEALFTLDPVNDSNDLIESTDPGSVEANQQVGDEIFNIQNDLETVEGNNQESEQVGVDGETSNDEEILQSLQIIQRNVKTGFDNLSLIGSVQVGLISFGIGAIIIYCYIGRIK